MLSPVVCRKGPRESKGQCQALFEEGLCSFLLLFIYEAVWNKHKGCLAPCTTQTAGSCEKNFRPLIWSAKLSGTVYRSPCDTLVIGHVPTLLKIPLLYITFICLSGEFGETFDSSLARAVKSWLFSHKDYPRRCQILMLNQWRMHLISQMPRCCAQLEYSSDKWEIIVRITIRCSVIR